MSLFVGKILRDDILAWLAGTAFPAVPAGGFDVALFTADPTAIDGTGGTEANYTGYARQNVTPASWLSAVSTSGSGLSAFEERSNAGVITFGTNTGAAAQTIVGRALYNHTTGDFLAYGDLPNPVVINIGSGYSIPIGDLLVEF